jgi:hypothetical protein
VKGRKPLQLNIKKYREKFKKKFNNLNVSGLRPDTLGIFGIFELNCSCSEFVEDTFKLKQGVKFIQGNLAIAH